MYCTACGKSNPDHFRYCTMCGVMLRGSSPQSPLNSQKMIRHSVDYIEFAFILQSPRPPISRFCIIVRINHQLIFAAIPEYANASKPVFVDAEIPEYSDVAESESKNGKPFVVHNEQPHRFSVLEIPKKILDKYRMMDQEQIQKETPVNFSVNSNDIKSVSYTLISTTSSVYFDPVLMTTFVPGNLSIEYGYKVSLGTGAETIVFIIRYEENVLDRLALLLGKTPLKSLK